MRYPWVASHVEVEVVVVAAVETLIDDEWMNFATFDVDGAELEAYQKVLHLAVEHSVAQAIE